MKEFIDLESVLGSSDTIWEDFVTELNNYPYKSEQGYVVTDFHRRSRRFLHQEHKKFNKNKDPNVLSNTFIDPNHYANMFNWTDEWNSYQKDSRITLVQQKENQVELEGNPLNDRIKYFPKVWNYIQSLPIKQLYRAVFINGSPGNELAPHKDWNQETVSPVEAHKMHILFINPKNNRPFYYKKDERKFFFNSSLFLFDNKKYEHGILAVNHLSSLIRLYCALDDEFCDKIGIYKVDDKN